MDDKKMIGAGAGPATVNGYTIDPSSAGYPALVTAAAAMNSVSDFTSSAACGPVQGFQNAWNSAGGSPGLTVDGVYGNDTASANAAVASIEGGNVPGGLTSGFPNCGGGGPPAPPQPPPGPIQPASGGMPRWLKILLGLVAAAAVIWAGTMLYKRSKKKGSHSAGEAPRRHKKRRKARRKSKRR